MSIEAINWAFKQDIIPAARKFVLIALADAADDYGVCWPSYNHLARKTSLTRRAVINNIKALMDEGLIEKATRIRANASDTSNAYRLPIINGSIADHPLSALFKSEMVNEMHPLVNDVHPPSEPYSPTGEPYSPLEPSENHHINQKEKKRVPRDVFLLEINKRFKDGFFDDLEVTETNVNTYGHMAYDHWEGYDKYPQGDVYTAFRGFVRIGQAENKLDRHIKKSTAKKSTYDPHSQWRARVIGWKEKGLAWMSQWGAPPDDPATKVPTEVLEDFGIQQKAKETA